MSYSFETRCIHGNDNILNNHPYGAISTPIYQTATFAHPGIGVSSGYDYTRVSNPTRDDLEHVIASLEEAGDAIATTTGMAAIDLVLNLFNRGDHIIASEDLYGGSVRLFDELTAKVGLSFTYVNTGDLEKVKAAIRPETKALYLETPSNPMMQITDLRACRELADEHDLLIIADNTFLTPYYQKPLTLGADIVVHSGTKYLSGHNDTLAGFVCTKTKELGDKLRIHYKTVGYCLSPFDSFLVLRGLKTLPLRMDRAQENAQKIAAFLMKHPKIRNVYYPGLADHPGYDVNRSQSTGFGGMLSFTCDSVKTARQVLEKVNLIMYAESLGGVETLVTYPMLQTHADLDPEVRNELGITDEFLRMSVGIENADDLIADLAQALED